MGLNFLPGEPNSLVNCMSTEIWNDIRLLVYCSGNNLIILRDASHLLQTIYLPSDGLAVAIEASSGAIAVSFGSHVRVFKPSDPYTNTPRSWDLLVELENASDPVNSLSWGGPCELFTGATSLALWQLPDESSKVEPRRIWSKCLANPAYHLVYSVDSWLVASAGKNDKLVKVWRRSSFDVDSVDFDFVYLPHPTRVLFLRWKQPFEQSQTIGNTLYTIAEDKVLRIWAALDSMDPGNFQLCGSVDFSGDDFAFVLDNRDVSRAIEAAAVVASSPSSTLDSKRVEDIINLGRKSPEVCITLNRKTRTVSAYTIENLELRKQKLVTISKFLHSQPLQTHSDAIFPFGSPSLDVAAYAPHRQIDFASGLSILVHDLVGTMYHFTIDLSELIGQSDETKPHRRKLLLNSILTGHKKSVQKIVRSSDGTRLFSQSNFSENALWKPHRLPTGITLQKSCLIQTDTDRRVLNSVILSGRDIVITLLDSHELVMWDCSSTPASVLARTSTVQNGEDPGIPLCMFLLPEPVDRHDLHLIIIYPNSHVPTWAITLPDKSKSDTSISYIGSFSLPEDDEIHLAVPVEPMGWDQTVGGGDQITTFQREVLITVSPIGVLRGWTAQFDADDTKLVWLVTNTVETGEKNVLRAQVSSTKKMVIANESGTELSIWDTHNNILEFKETFSADNTISDLDWTTTPDNQCVLGVGFAKEVVLYCQQRFDYTNKTPSWVAFRKVDISQFTSHRIGDSIWLQDGTFVVGAGNQLFIQDQMSDPKDETNKQLLGSRYTKTTAQNISTIFDICTILNGPLPVYHPQLLIQLIFADHLELVKYILRHLLRRLRFAPILEQQMVADIKSTLDLDVSALIEINWQQLSRRGSVISIGEDDPLLEPFSTKMCEDLLDWLHKVSLPYLTRHQQITLASAVEAVGFIEEEARSLDLNGIKFLLGFKLYKIHRGTQDSMTTRDFNWALHSESQNLLLDVIKKSQTGAMLWPAVREVGIPYWVRHEELKDLFDTLGRNYFNYDGKRDPVRCSLYYLALHKKPVLLGLWRTSTGNKEQQKTIKLLSNDYTQARWKSAALKNAYALLGKHRYEYAAAFFLLADSIKDAVNVLVRYIDDVPLAIAVARVYEGDDGPALKELITTHILPEAELSGDRWMMGWALWMLKDWNGAIKALAWGRSTVSRSFLIDDPVLGVLYRYLKNKLRTQHREVKGTSVLASRLASVTGSGAVSVFGSPNASEFRFVLKTASIYSRMGCDILALDLLRTWTFEHPSIHDVDVRLTKLQLDEQAVEPLEEPKQVPAQPEFVLSEKVAQTLKPAAPTAFQEPDMSSFSFGF